MTDNAVIEYKYQPMVKVGSVDGLKGLGEMMRSRIIDMLPRHITPDNMLSALYAAAYRTPKIYECTQDSIIKSLIDASMSGLDCSGKFGLGYLIPRNNKTTKKMECQFMPGYRGLIDVATRYGSAQHIDSRLVYEQDHFVVTGGTSPGIEHVPYLGPDRKKVVTHVYAVAFHEDGPPQFEVMTYQECLDIRNRNSYWKSTPWATDEGEMLRKTVVRRLFKYLRTSPRLDKAIEASDQFDSVVVDITPEASTVGTGTRTGSLSARLLNDNQPREPETPQQTMDPSPESASPVLAGDTGE